MGTLGEIENPVSRWLSLKILILLGEETPSLAYQAHQEALSESSSPRLLKEPETRSSAHYAGLTAGMGQLFLFSGTLPLPANHRRKTLTY